MSSSAVWTSDIRSFKFHSFDDKQRPARRGKDDRFGDRQDRPRTRFTENDRRGKDSRGGKGGSKGGKRNPFKTYDAESED